MDDKLENIDKVVKYWKDTSEKDYQTMQNLLKSKDFSWAMFLGHLVLEKLLKAYYVKSQEKHTIFTHDLLRLASKTGLEISEEYEEWLDEISTFNINARYDNYKQDFYKLCTKEFTDLWPKRINILRQWLINEL
ncbi:HEPN domain-containing protein [Aquiflexum sp. TKW24L]|uniref:HEPN domain-containing protein n=1 Tax=Aquiflexum sp. TKW24L TaxID=2942212 RepID=UPI0020BF3D65|nr:HEPN domain-containing protein [Aquiflexum sp. TKW24L]